MNPHVGTRKQATMEIRKCSETMQVLSFSLLVVLLCLLLGCCDAMVQRPDGTLRVGVNSSHMNDNEKLLQLEELVPRALLSEVPPGLNQLKDACTIEIYDHVCVNRATESNGAQNTLNNNNRGEPEVPGTTYWINEWMAPGHMSYDLQFLQVLHVASIDRIVLQRAPCFRKDFCEGVTYWNSFFKGIYSAAVLSTNRDVPVYLRMYPSESAWKPHMLTREDILGDPSKYPDIAAKPTVCFERLIRKSYNTGCAAKCNGMMATCFSAAVTKEVASKFKQSAYKLVSPEIIVPISMKDYPKFLRIITIAHRSGIARGMANPEGLYNAVKNHFAGRSDVLVRLFNTRNSSVTYQEQIKLMATSDVVICSHGAFVGNVIYMRDDSLLVELSGNYDNIFNALPFEKLASLFSVKRVTATISGLVNQDTVNYAITEEETNTILRLVAEYLALQ
jgi:hypothetical protein